MRDSKLATASLVLAVPAAQGTALLTAVQDGTLDIWPPDYPHSGVVRALSQTTPLQPPAPPPTLDPEIPSPVGMVHGSDMMTPGRDAASTVGNEQRLGWAMQLAAGGGTFLGAAQQNMFAIDTDAATQMMTSIEQIRGSLNKRLRRIHELKTQAMLGDLPEAQAVTKLDALVASGDPQSLDFVLQRFIEALDHLHQAIEICIRNYQQDDAQAAHDFRRISEIWVSGPTLPRWLWLRW